MNPAVRLFVGGHAATVQSEHQGFVGTGDRMFSAAHPPQVGKPGIEQSTAIVDSGAFTDPPDRRLSAEQALDRQLKWERKAEGKWGAGWRAFGFVSYDLLIDETWIGGQKHKRRWSLKQAEWAVRETVSAAQYLSSQRERVEPRTLVLSAQGVDALQYAECAAGVLQCAQPGDWFGFGGWCIIGRFTSYLREFWRTIRLVLPMVRVAGLDHVHIFGVLYEPALGGLLWLADQYEITVSTDSSAPVVSCTRPDPRKAGVRAASGYWRDNVDWWINHLANMRASIYYREPPDIKPTRQLAFDDL